MALRAFLLVLGLVSVGAQVFAQDLAVPSSWGTTTSKDTRAAREAYANGAARALVSRIGPTNGSLPDQSNGQALASMYATLALSDLLSGNKTWQDAVIGGVQNWTGKNDIYTNGTAGSQRTNTNGMHWALAYYYAYKAYGQQSFLTLAQNAWDTTHGQYISTKTVAAKPNVPGRNISFNTSDCFDSTAIGGVFWLPDVPNNNQIQADNVGPFSVLAGYLYEATQNETYKTAGLASVQFMGSDNFYDSSSNYVYGVADIHDCSWNTGLSPGFQAWYIQPLSIWANITRDSALTQRLRQVVSTTAHTSAWTEADGVLLDPNANISDNPWDDKAILVRALGEVLRRFPSSSDLATFVQAFVTVQYNVLTNNARVGDNYSPTIFGPAPQAYSSKGNIIAMDVLNAAFGLLPHDPSATSAPTTSQSSTAAPASSTPVGAIAGGAVAGVIAIAALIGALLWFRRTRRRPGPVREPFDRDMPGDGASEPFMAAAPEPFMDERPSTPSRANSYTSATSHYDPWAAERADAPLATAGPSNAFSYPPTSAATVHPKLARMNAPPPPSRGTSFLASPPASEAASGSGGGGGGASTVRDGASTQRSQTQDDIPELVRGLVDNLLREHGAAPPRYDG